jgi:hypothetical protein
MSDEYYDGNELDVVIQRFEPAEILERVAAQLDTLFQDGAAFKRKDLARMQCCLKAIEETISDKFVHSPASGHAVQPTK